MSHLNDTLTFDQLTDANRRRLPLFKNRAGGPAHSQPDGSDWNLAEWTNAVAGETGEACNLAKKIIRGDFGAPGMPSYQQALKELALELADIVTYADIACQRTGHKLGEVVAEKFNVVSERVGCDVTL
jgi:NTP pyrophosphatase (non-canonical NTP hydrolase)